MSCKVGDIRTGVPRLCGAVRAVYTHVRTSVGQSHLASAMEDRSSVRDRPCHGHNCIFIAFAVLVTESRATE